MSIAFNQNALKAILNVIKPILDLDQVAKDLHFFFKRPEEVFRITLAKHRPFIYSNSRAKGELETVFFEGDTEIKWV